MANERSEARGPNRRINSLMIRDSGFLVLLHERASDDFDAVAHECAKREAPEGHQHLAYLIPCEGSAVDHQQRDLPTAPRIPRDAADQMAGVVDPPAEFAPLHVADRESISVPVVQQPEQVPHLGVAVAGDRELVALLLIRTRSRACRT